MPGENRDMKYYISHWWASYLVLQWAIGSIGAWTIPIRTPFFLLFLIIIHPKHSLTPQKWSTIHKVAERALQLIDIFKPRIEKKKKFEEVIMEMKSTSNISGESKRKFSCKGLGGFLKEQRGRLYIIRRCVVMLLCWHD